MQKSARELGGEPKRLSAEAMRVLQAFAWPGNVRQLENACHWLTVMAPGQVIDAKDLPPEIREAVGVAVLEAPARVVPASAVHDELAGPAPGLAMHVAASGSPRGAAAGATVGTPPGAHSWSQLLEREVSAQLAAQPAAAREDMHSDLMDRLAREFEGTVIRTALRHTRGRRIDAAVRLGIGRNTITRKIQELRLEDDEAA
jgi:two-component system nitrogen regulation response regulator GlnG